MINTLITVYIDKLNIKNIKNKLLLKYYKKNVIEDLYIEYTNKNLTLKDIQNKMEEILSDKEKYGAVFTPNYIVDTILNKTIIHFNNPIICDLSCGNGAFLVPSAVAISKSSNKSIIDTIESNIYGVDILEENIEYTKIILSLLALSYGEDKEEILFHLYKEDGLSKNLFEENKFDCILGNPPYIQLKNMDKQYTTKIKKEYLSICKGNSNIYFAFMEQCIGKYLKENGISGLIIPNGIASLLSAEPIRKILSGNINHIKEVIDFKDKLVFENVKIYTAIYFLTKKHNDFIIYNNEDVSIEHLDYKQWHFLTHKHEQNIIKIKSFNNKLSITGSVSTNCDKIYFIEDNNIYNDKYYHKNIDNKFYEIEKELVIDFIKVGNYRELKIIFPYSVKDEKDLMEKFPKAYSYFLDMKSILEKRDLQNAKWYEYARKQGLSIHQYKLLFSNYCKKPKFIKNENGTLFTNGFAVVCKDKREMNIYYKVLNSIIMEYYMKQVSYSIENGYLCYQKGIVAKFTIPDFTIEEEEFLLNTEDANKINKFLLNKYNITL